MSRSKYSYVFRFRKSYPISAMKRLTREESRAQTRERLLDSAYTVFVREGIDAAAIEDVAEEAGYSRGAFYSNFETKDDLVCALLEREKDRLIGGFEAVIQSDLPPDEMIRNVREFYVGMGTNKEHCGFWLAIQHYALRNPAVRPRVAEIQRQDRDAVIAMVRRVYGALCMEVPAAPEMVAIGLIAIAQGFGLTQSLEPEAFTEQELRQYMEGLFNRIAGLTTESERSRASCASVVPAQTL